jgi:hypothetical protein
MSHRSYWTPIQMNIYDFVKYVYTIKVITVGAGGFHYGAASTGFVRLRTAPASSKHWSQRNNDPSSFRLPIH